MGDVVDVDGISADMADAGGPRLVVLHEWWGSSRICGFLASFAVRSDRRRPAPYNFQATVA